MTLFPAETPIESLDWIPRPRLVALRRLGITSLGDLLRHFPRRYENRVKFDRFPDQASDTAVCLFGEVKKTSYRRFGPRTVFEARVEEENAGVLSSPLICRWFNLPWVQKAISGGQRIVLYGKPKIRANQVVMEHPEFETIEEDAEVSIHFDRIVPIHPAGDGITPRLLRTLVHRAIGECEALPLLCPQHDASLAARVWRAIHFPESTAECDHARQLLTREEFFGLQLIVCARHAKVRMSGGTPRAGKGKLWSQVVAALPFEITASQRDVMAEISHDLAAPHRMNRLLQGDVGSGKTLVALHAMLQTVEAGWQAVLMAPTQILAEQHYINFRNILDPLGIPVALRTAARREDSGTPDAGAAHASRRFPPLVIGTHALLFDGAELERPGLFVIDEQHKFGVLQRSRLIERGDAPDVLVMTATPIPRTITQTLYGDLDVSTLREKPTGRGHVVTAARDTSKLPDIIAFLQKKIAAGRQAYIIYPLIDESEKLESKAAAVEFKKWRGLLAPATVGLIHGRLDAAEKNSVMRGFRDGTVSVLVSTTVVEVGVDVPNACLMLIENADRFGLSQIHQLRGRIGRGASKSYCILLHSGASDAAREKLAVLEQTTSGFEIAEADLRIRGPGDLLGTAQTGLPPLHLGDLLRDRELMTETRRIAQSILLEDPRLTHPGHAKMRAFVEKSSAQIQAASG